MNKMSDQRSMAFLIMCDVIFVLEIEFLVSPMYWMLHLVQKIIYTQLEVLGLKLCESLYFLFVVLFLTCANLTNGIDEFLVFFGCAGLSLALTK